ncbi:MAG: MBL fold metallo-hydrolase [Chitinivibrionales bacterium]
MRIKFLGTGTSHGVPPVDCMLSNYAKCPTGICRKALIRPGLQRTRSSVLVDTNEGSILIDVSPEFRMQVLKNRVKDIDAVLITHPHADHIGGIPDIRSYTSIDKPVPVFGSEEALECIERYFPYIFDSDAFEGGGIPRITTEPIKGDRIILGKRVVPVPVFHSTLKEPLGYRIGDFGYIPDVKAFKQGSIELLRGVEVLVMDALRREYPHPTHVILPESLEIARSIGPKRCYFTHISHGIDPEVDGRELENWISFAYDGLEIECG